MKDEVPIIVWLLLTLFIGLKLSNNIDWSWWYIAAPVWGWIAFNFVYAFIKAFITASVASFKRTRR